MTVEVITLGCRLNAYESEVIRAKAREAGLDNAIIVNTCAVTAEAVRQARQNIRRARKDNPGAKVIVTGCAAQTEPETFADMPEVDQVLGNADKLDARSYAFDAPTERVLVNDIMSVKETASHLIAGFDGRARAFVQIQNGCDHRCTFCIIPYGRGNSRSVPAGEVVQQIRGLAAQGIREVVLTGVDITAYGADLPGAPKLGRLVEQILTLVPELPRLRLSSLDVAECDERLIDLVAREERLMPHLHLSLQAGHDMILKRMKRRHTTAQAVAFCDALRARRPDIVFGADLIAGFPTETDEMFEATLNHVRDCGLTYLHVFPFSARERTPAARMPQVKGNIIKARAARLRDAGALAVTQHLASLNGHEVDLLVEQDVSARTPTFAPVKLKHAMPSGTLVRARITHADDRFAYAQPLPSPAHEGGRGAGGEGGRAIARALVESATLEGALHV
ncbi:MAG: tRNA (N(6)-L-threonylcarbamoyladenosine(37)-C(2))-methylthiotransferase MtaB [Alphaproteobacteria bacterium]|nr:tRNA (N(6)-L-threonylcarbamoyladenosine(37)-C(2))-methylthiotransferase MtaB [Alphaproteobacteria bacterium]